MIDPCHLPAPAEGSLAAANSMSGALVPQFQRGVIGGVGERYLAERGVTISTAQEHGVEIDAKPASDRFQERLGFDMVSAGKLSDLVQEVIWFPCRDIKCKTVSWIARPLPTVGSAKFLNTKGDAFPFIPGQTWEAVNKPHKPLVFTEGPVKALALAQAGQLPIGVSGVWMATHKGSDENIELVPALALFEWSGRTVYLSFDADWKTNPDVKQALFRTFMTLYRQGAKVRFLKWLPSEGKGIDDYLHGKQAAKEAPVDALAKLLDDAEEVSSLLVPEDLAMVHNELANANLTHSQLSQITRIVSAPLQVRASALEQDFINNGAESTDNTFVLTDPEPWPGLADGAALLREILQLVRQYVVMSEAQAVAVALWTFLTYLEAHTEVLPILAITSPQKRCGKTTLLSILRRLVRKPLPASNVTAAALFRAIAKWTPTLLIDEADTFLKEDKALRGILNAGHTRDLAYVLRTNNDSLEPERFSTWGPKAIACIGKLPETLADRSVNIRLQRRTQNEGVARLRDAEPEVFCRLTRQLMRWAMDQGEKVRSYRPLIPPILNDRAADNWLPLLAIAGTVGGDWPELASRAALDLQNALDRLQHKVGSL